MKSIVQKSKDAIDYLSQRLPNDSLGFNWIHDDNIIIFLDNRKFKDPKHLKETFNKIQKIIDKI